MLESINHALSIGRELEALLSDWWSRDVPAQPLESATISTVYRRTCVHVDTTDVCWRSSPSASHHGNAGMS
jgi:hypothetical protein